MKVIGDNIIVEVFKKEPQTDGGILIPENMSNLEKGKVICVGTGLEKEDLESGDIVTFNRNSGSLIEQDDRNLVKLHKDTILFFEKRAKGLSVIDEVIRYLEQTLNVKIELTKKEPINIK